MGWVLVAVLGAVLLVTLAGLLRALVDPTPRHGLSWLGRGRKERVGALCFGLVFLGIGAYRVAGPGQTAADRTAGMLLLAVLTTQAAAAAVTRSRGTAQQPE